MIARPPGFKVKLFADGADLPRMRELSDYSWIEGFTTNPTLMRQAGISDYHAFAAEVLAAVPDRPVSFEVCSDEWDDLEDQAKEIASWGANVYVKVPVTNTRGELATELIRRLSHEGIRLNVTAIMTLPQVEAVCRALVAGAPSFISVFAGRIADTGRDPVPLMIAALRVLTHVPRAQLIWASPREILNVVQADQIGCHVITVTYDILQRLRLIGRDLEQYSLETVRMLYQDAISAGLTCIRRTVRT